MIAWISPALTVRPIPLRIALPSTVAWRFSILSIRSPSLDVRIDELAGRIAQALQPSVVKVAISPLEIVVHRKVRPARLPAPYVGLHRGDAAVPFAPASAHDAAQNDPRRAAAPELARRPAIVAGLEEALRGPIFSAPHERRGRRLHRRGGEKNGGDHPTLPPRLISLRSALPSTVACRFSILSIVVALCRRRRRRRQILVDFDRSQ